MVSNIFSITYKKDKSCRTVPLFNLCVCFKSCVHTVQYTLLFVAVQDPAPRDPQSQDNPRPGGGGQDVLHVLARQDKGGPGSVLVLSLSSFYILCVL